MEQIEQQTHISHYDWSELQSQVESEGGAGTNPDPALLNRLTLRTEALLSDSQKLERLTKVEMARAVQAAQERITSSVRVLITAAMLAVILALGLGVLLARPLVARLARASEAR